MDLVVVLQKDEKIAMGSNHLCKSSAACYCLLFCTAVYSGGMSRELAHPLSTTRLHSLQITEAERAKEQYSAATTVAQPERFYAVHKSAFLVR